MNNSVADGATIDCYPITDKYSAHGPTSPFIRLAITLLTCKICAKSCAVQVEINCPTLTILMRAVMQEVFGFGMRSLSGAKRRK